MGGGKQDNNVGVGGPGTDMEIVRFPIFGVSWSSSLLVYCGGGGSSKTGVGNAIVMKGDATTGGGNGSINSSWTSINTGEKTCMSIDIHPKRDFPSPPNNAYGPVYIAAAIEGGPVQIYHSSTKHCMGSCHPEREEWGKFLVVKFHPNGHNLLVGSDNGTIISFALHFKNVAPGQVPDLDNPPKVTLTKLAIFRALVAPTQTQPATRGPPPLLVDHKAGHSRAITSMAFNPFPQQANLCEFISVARDGCLKMWNYQHGELITSVTCPVQPIGQPLPKLPVRGAAAKGCVYAANGFIYTVQSSRKGEAYLSQWRKVTQQVLNQAATDKHNPQVQISLIELARIAVGTMGMSSMSISLNGTTIYLGAAGGNAMIVDADSLKITKTYNNVHDLPITAIAPRPCPLLSPSFQQSIDYGVEFITVSGDSKLVYLSTRRQPLSWFVIWFNLIVLSIIAVLIYYTFVGNDCYIDLIEFHFDVYKSCIQYSLIAPHDMPGVMSIPM